MIEYNDNPEEETGSDYVESAEEELVSSDPRDPETDDDSQPNVYVIDSSLSHASLAGDLEAARQLAAEYLDIAQRTRAELINFRKRVEAERQDYQRHSIEQVIIDLLPAQDSLAQAIQIYEAVPDGENPLVDGMRKTAQMIHRILAKHGAEAINVPQVPFDPNLHMPLMTEESAEVKEPFVSEIYQQGVRVGDHIVKPAMVKVLVPLGNAVESEGGEGADE